MVPFFSTVLVVADATHLKIENVEVGGRVDEVDERLRQLLVLVEVHELGWNAVLVVGMILLLQIKRLFVTGFVGSKSNIDSWSMGCVL